MMKKTVLFSAGLFGLLAASAVVNLLAPAPASAYDRYYDGGRREVYAPPDYVPGQWERQRHHHRRSAFFDRAYENCRYQYAPGSNRFSRCMEYQIRNYDFYNDPGARGYFDWKLRNL